jgi:hypothetical protein
VIYCILIAKTQMIIMDFLNASYVELESVTGIPACNWSLYFHKKRRLSMRNLERIAEALGLSSADVLNLIEARQKAMFLRKKNKTVA